MSKLNDRPSSGDRRRPYSVNDDLNLGSSGKSREDNCTVSNQRHSHGVLSPGQSYPSVDSKNPAQPNSASHRSSNQDVGAKILAQAMEAAGLAYNWGGGSCRGPSGSPKGFDCSGLVAWAVCKVTGRDLFSEDLRQTAAMYCAPKSKLQYRYVVITPAILALYRGRRHFSYTPSAERSHTPNESQVMQSFLEDDAIVLTLIPSTTLD